MRVFHSTVRVSHGLYGRSCFLASTRVESRMLALARERIELASSLSLFGVWWEQ